MFQPNYWTHLIGQVCKYFGVAIYVMQTASDPPVVPHAGMPDKEHEKLMEKAKRPHGMLRITRHGLAFSNIMLAIGHMLTRPHYGDFAFYVWIPIIWIIGGAHQDYRLRQEYPKEYFEQTSALPFVAILQGRNSLKKAMEEVNLYAVFIALMCPIFVA